MCVPVCIGCRRRFIPVNYTKLWYQFHLRTKGPSRKYVSWLRSRDNYILRDHFLPLQHYNWVGTKCRRYLECHKINTNIYKRRYDFAIFIMTIWMVFIHNADYNNTLNIGWMVYNIHNTDFMIIIKSLSTKIYGTDVTSLYLKSTTCIINI